MVTKMLLFLQKISKNKLKMKDVIFSVLSSFIGIQSNKNRERDFKSSSAYYFIFFGFAITLIFIIFLYIFVNFILL